MEVLCGVVWFKLTQEKQGITRRAHKPHKLLDMDYALLGSFGAWKPGGRFLGAGGC